MNVLNNINTRMKLIGGFMLLALLTALVGGIGIYYIRQIDAADTRLYQNNTVPISQLTEISVAFQRTRVDLRDLLAPPRIPAKPRNIMTQSKSLLA